MKRRSIRRNDKADVLGLPMYLIIIMIVAVAVIAAVVFMIPKADQSILASVSNNDATQVAVVANYNPATNEWDFPAFTVNINVTTNDDSRNPIAGATVRLRYGSSIATGKTDYKGWVELTFSTATNNAVSVPANILDAYMKLSVQATGFEDYEDNYAVFLLTP